MGSVPNLYINKCKDCQHVIDPDDPKFLVDLDERGRRFGYICLSCLRDRQSR